MHCDYLNLTVPESHSREVCTEVASIASYLGASLVYEGLYKLVTGGTAKVDHKKGFTVFGASGDFLASLRGHNMFPSYLSLFGDCPHNVSQMHIAHDVHTDTPRIINALYRRVQTDRGVRLSRKKLRPETQVRKLTSPGTDGRETGTIYLGSRSAEVWAKVYDKQHERKQNANQAIPVTTRYELSVSGKAGASLRDAFEPDAIFWHFMSDILSAPPDAPEWVKGGQGFSLPERVSLLPAEALRRLLERSPELGQMFGLADRMGPHGYDYLLRLVHGRYQQHLRANQQSLDSGSSRLNA